MKPSKMRAKEAELAATSGWIGAASLAGLGHRLLVRAREPLSMLGQLPQGFRLLFFSQKKEEVPRHKKLLLACSGGYLLLLLLYYNNLSVFSVSYYSSFVLPSFLLFVLLLFLLSTILLLIFSLYIYICIAQELPRSQVVLGWLTSRWHFLQQHHRSLMSQLNRISYMNLLHSSWSKASFSIKFHIFK